MKLNKKNIWSLVGIFLLWRIFLFIVAALAGNFLNYQPSFPYSNELINQHWLPHWIRSFANFDGVHYLTIAQKGYFGTGLIQAFFPIFPLLISFLSFISKDYLISGLLISNSASLIMIILWHLVSEKYLKFKNSSLGVLLLLAFPTSFFFGAIYNESLFISLILAVFILSREKKWFLAGLMGGLAAATRVVGIYALLIILIEAWQTHDKKLLAKNTLKKYALIWLSCFFTILGLVGYMIYLQLKFNDPLYFLHLQSEFGAGRQTNIVLYPQVVWRYFKILLTARPINWKYYSYVQDLIIGLGGMLILVWQLWQKFKHKLNQVPLSLIIFSLLAFITPTLTGTFSSMPRYVLVCLSIFIWLNQCFEKKPGWKILYFLVSISMLIINTILFIQGYWVS